jgi:phenylalanyl-tRNA synthetase beta chain
MGGVMGGESTGCSDDTVDVFLEAPGSTRSASPRPAAPPASTATPSTASPARSTPARSCPGLELATKLILELCGGEPSEIVVAGEAPAAPGPILFDPAYVEAAVGPGDRAERTLKILTDLGFTIAPPTDVSTAAFATHAESLVCVTPPTFRRDVEGKADLVEEVARIAGYGALPSTPCPRFRAPSAAC